jgi:ligand-binding SRPBCC domain-containing protein
VVINVCPAAVTTATPARVWGVLTAMERLAEWVDASLASAEPPGPIQVGQRIQMSAPGLGRRWPVEIDVAGIDPEQRWIDFRVRLPFGVVNHEHVTLTETDAGGTLVRFN